MGLRDLVGLKTLDAVDFEKIELKDKYCGIEHASCCRFRLDGVLYAAIEDPDDGYRSHMSELVIDDAVPRNVFPAVHVMCVYKDRDEPDACDLLEIIDAHTGKTILTVGTNNTDDYYPYFVADFDPSAMATNSGGC